MVMVGGGAAAQPRNAVEAAKAHFKAGEELYDAGEYADAIREWSAGYELAPRAPFLLNLGQAYRKMRSWPKAAEYFRRYLATAAPDDAHRGEVRLLLAEMQRMMAASRPASSPPAKPEPARASVAAPVTTAPTAAAPSSAAPAIAVAPTEGPATATPATASPGAAALVAASPAPPPRRSFLRRNWWILPAGAVVVGVVLGVSVYYGTQPANRFSCTGTISCIDASGARSP